MHELSVCQGLLAQCKQIAAERGANGVSRIVVRVGPLSGVEPKLLRDAFPIAAAGGIADSAELVIENLPIRVTCNKCGGSSEATSSNLTCRHCGDWQTRLTGGDELLLASLELEVESDS